MSRKNFKVATTEDGKTTLTKIDKTPTGKVKTLKDKEKIRKAREEQYKNFRIGALERRAKRMGLTDEQIKVKVKELITQIDTPNSYLVLVLFNSNDADLVKQALLKEGLVWKMMSNSHFYIDADQETLATLRSIMPPSAKIHPYVKKKPSVLPQQKAENVQKKPTNNKKETSKFHTKHPKRSNIAGISKKKRKEFKANVKSLQELWKAKYPKKATVVHIKAKKRSNASKKASTLKKAA